MEVTVVVFRDDDIVGEPEVFESDMMAVGSLVGRGYKQRGACPDWYIRSWDGGAALLYTVQVKGA